MSVLINGMKMPTSCFDCPISHFAYCRTIACGITGKTISAPDCEKQRIDNCPLVPVPEHGDLIDRDYVKEHLYACETNGRPLHTLELCELLDAINDIPTIIQASEEAE